MTDERFPCADAAGEPLGIDSFVRVLIANRLAPKHPVEFRGVVTRIELDAKGPVLVIREWGGRELLPGFRFARPEHCLTTRYPSALRSNLTARAARKNGGVR